ncbi:PREDICTED: LOW QUALITY PROTEIN: ferrochelatase-2, chloroplastic [Erythranthe guttata]|uniref:LOW QUALITY PROTEIN: ferrochelatase-2, chloroplastic n=1 Tax=Erythranthe guttata TaxID=4155 RepID=UPI00064DEECA|nr:PREDICTED: LOW QUALITY PROTEIN: ferrochelatase-2, chloroplastic [Erythranthe guttata]|eukprot:XP_012857743.1 PREDICTED: LOW QUALITY PROTEIN: ferrochelatase-2, chloroplastic [Erythranthe guttata]
MGDYLSNFHHSRGKQIVGRTFSSARVCTFPKGDIDSYSHTSEEKIGVMLLNLGGPDTLNDVQSFLFNLFAYPDIIRLPRFFRFLQRPLAQLISVLRAPKGKEGCAPIGGGSPLRKITDEQSVADLIEKELQIFPNPEEIMILFSTHGVPVSYVEDAGDPYKDQMEDCIFLIMQELKSRGIGNNHTLAYQRRVGPVQWLKPYADEVLVELGQQGVKSLLAVPVSFVSGHIETLEDIDMEYRELALESGIVNWSRVPALNCKSSFITDLADVVIEALPSAMEITTTAEAESDILQYAIKMCVGSILAYIFAFFTKTCPHSGISFHRYR